MSKIRQHFAKPQVDSAIPGWMVYSDWFLKVAIFLSGVYQTFFGETGIGIVILLCWTLISVPQIVTRKKVSHIPLEIEFFLFIMVFLQFVIGEARDWYTEVPYYDKLVHLMLPMLMGLTGFLLVYTLYYYKKLIAPIWAMAVIMILVSIGIGALWEIVEYTSDELIYPRVEGWHHFQGSLTEDALHDTMNDLIADTIGASVGALIGVLYIRGQAKRENQRLGGLMAEISAPFAAKPAKATKQRPASSRKRLKSRKK